MLKKSIIVVVALILSIGMLNIRYAYGMVKIIRQSWNLVDSGKHLDWDGSTTYLTSFKKGINTWNAYHAGVIRKDTKDTKLDVTISDIDVVNGYAGLTYKTGKIQLNKAYLSQSSYTSKHIQNVCTHELGHALGLDHNQKGDIMYRETTAQTSLSHNDKATYDDLYYNYY